MRTTEFEKRAVRIGDAEREACVETLNEHHVRGRLSVEELDERQRAALTAVTEADLQELVADLPNGRNVRRSPRSQIVSDSCAVQPRAPGDFWELEPPERALRLLGWAVPPAVLSAGGVVVATVVNSADDLSMFAGGVGTGVLGFATHWALSRRRR